MKTSSVYLVLCGMMVVAECVLYVNLTHSCSMPQQIITVEQEVESIT